MLSILKKILISTFIAILIALGLFQRQDFFKNLVKNQIKNLPAFKDNFFNCEINNINLFFPCIKLKNLVCRDKNNLWRWKCKSFKLSFSWLDLILQKKLKPELKINTWNIFSYAKNNNIEIADHLKQLIEKQLSVTVEIKQIYTKNCNIRLRNKENKITFETNWNSQSKEINNILKSSLYVSDGYLKISKLKEITDLAGTIHANLSLTDQVEKNNIDINCTFHAPQIKAKRCFLKGKIKNNESEFKLTNIDGRLKIDPIKIRNNNFSAKIEFPLKYAKKFLNNKYNNLISESTCSANIYGNISLDKIYGDINFHNLGNKVFKIDLFKIHFNKNNNLNGNFEIKNGFLDLVGKYNLNNKSKGQITLTNKNSIDLEKIFIEPEKILLKLNLENLDKINSEYSIDFKKFFNTENSKLAGKIEYQNESLNFNGNLDNYKYNGKINTNPSFEIVNLQIFNSIEEILNINSTENQKIETNIDYKFIQEILPNPINEMFSGSGTLLLSGYKNKDKIIGELDLKSGKIILPNLYNVITNFKCKIKIENNKITIKNLNIELYKGSIECKKAIIILNGLNQKPLFMHLPLKFNNVFINYKKELISSISGNINFQKLLNVEKSSISGNIILNKCNINLEKNQKSKTNIPEIPIDINISVITKQPIKLITEQLECKTQGNIKLEKHESLNISGNAEIISGFIKFPYKNLNITNGRIHLVPFNQILEITAKGKIKNHLLTVHIEGPVKKPSILLESSPQLSDEEIGSLLITGSKNTSMNILAPSLIMQNLQNIIVKSNKTNTEILKPLKHVRLISNLKDQQGGSGLTGGIEIDFNDRLHALIQKDLNSSEETHLEIDYQVSDDINIRGTKDENGDISGEIEMVWKF